MRIERFEMGRLRLERRLGDSWIELWAHDPEGPAGRPADPWRRQQESEFRFSIALGPDAPAPSAANLHEWPLWNGLPLVENCYDPFGRLLRWAYGRLRAADPPPLAVRRRTMREVYAVARDSAIHAAAIADPASRRLALRFVPHLRYWLYTRLVADRSGRIAECAALHPGVLVFAHALHQMGERGGRPDASAPLLAGVAAGRRLPAVLGEAIERWAAASAQAADSVDEDHAAGFARVHEAMAERPRLLAEKRLLVMRAGFQVATTDLWRPPPLAWAPEDVPAATRANARWYRAVTACPEVLGAERLSAAAAERLSRFVSRHGVALAAAARRRGLHVRSLLAEVVDWSAHGGRTPDRGSSVAGVLEASERWHREVAARGWQDDAPLDPATRLPASGFGASPQVDPRLAVAPIERVGGLAAEGEAMGHCVATRAREALSGRAFYFSASYGAERLTIELRGPPGVWRVSEMRGVANRAPSRAATAAVARWLASATTR